MFIGWGGGQAAGVRAPPRPVSSRGPRLLTSFVCSSVRERAVFPTRGTWRGWRPSTFTPVPPHPPPPSLSVVVAIHMQVTCQPPPPPILLFYLSTPGQAAVSRLKFKSRGQSGAVQGPPSPGPPPPSQARGQARPGPQQTKPGSQSGLRRTGGGPGGGSVWMLIFYQGSVRDGGLRFRGWAGVTLQGQLHSGKRVCRRRRFNHLINPGNVMSSRTDSRV